jgi:hypothetical protein
MAPPLTARSEVLEPQAPSVSRERDKADTTTIRFMVFFLVCTRVHAPAAKAVDVLHFAIMIANEREMNSRYSYVFIPLDIYK